MLINVSKFIGQFGMRDESLFNSKKYIIKSYQAILRVGATKGIRPMEINNYHITTCSLTTGNRPTLLQCGKAGVVKCGLRSRDIKH